MSDGSLQPGVGARVGGEGKESAEGAQCWLQRVRAPSESVGSLGLWAWAFVLGSVQGTHQGPRGT